MLNCLMKQSNINIVMLCERCGQEVNERRQQEPRYPPHPDPRAQDHGYHDPRARPPPPMHRHQDPRAPPREHPDARHPSEHEEEYVPPPYGHRQYYGPQHRPYGYRRFIPNNFHRY